MKHFKIQEFVSPDMYARRGQKSIELIDQRLIETMDALRKNLGRVITINNWIYNGTRTQSGLRDRSFFDSDQDYINSLSQHKYGRAADFLVKGLSATEVRQHILENLDLYPHIKFLEVDINWNHIDVRNSPEVICWSPNRGFMSVYDVLKQKV